MRGVRFVEAEAGESQAASVVHRTLQLDDSGVAAAQGVGGQLPAARRINESNTSALRPAVCDKVVWRRSIACARSGAARCVWIHASGEFHATSISPASCAATWRS